MTNVVESRDWRVRDEAGEEHAFPANNLIDAIDIARDWMGEASFDTSSGTVYYTASLFEVIDAGEEDEEEVFERHLTVEFDPPEPECTEMTRARDLGAEHDWQSPYSVLGGLKENPGAWGHGGGVIIKEVCRHCGQYRVTDTWAQNPSNGEQGLRSVKYEDADEASEAWVESLAQEE